MKRTLGMMPFEYENMKRKEKNTHVKIIQKYGKLASMYAMS